MGTVINMPVNSHKDLAVWQKAMDLVVKIYSLTKQFPRDELYSLTNQIRRAAISIPSNIAEGKAKRSKRDFVNFIAIARGSAAELETQLLISQRLAYISVEQARPVLDDINEIGRMLSGLLSKLEAAST
ncbi:MAG TPA: four helix bundle protein [Alphaproteobacteria bacterium]|nr:four helix bundle protein [Alphaproteobacteria bacterium]